MSCRLPPWSDFFSLVRASAEDAEHRLSLLERAAPILYAEAEISTPEPKTLADQFERWRYPCLRQFDGQITPFQRDLVDGLDAAARAIGQPPQHPPKNLRTADWRALVEHGRFLRRRLPHPRLAFSFPRHHDAPDGFTPARCVGDQALMRRSCALRLGFPTAELVLSTRERPALRNRLAAIYTPQMSPESSINPGGFETNPTETRSREQFPVMDDRTAAEIADWLDRAGCEAP